MIRMIPVLKIPVFVFCLLCTKSVMSELKYNVQIALMYPFDHPDSMSPIGAVSVALDRISHEQLLPDFQFDIIERNCECKEDTALGLVLELLEHNLADVIVGSPCPQPAYITAALCTKYDVPFLNWAAPMSELIDEDRFNMMSTMAPPPTRFGQALTALLTHFQWNRIAIFYTANKSSMCYSIAESTINHLTKIGIHIAFTMSIVSDEPTDSDIQQFLDGLQLMARVAIICVGNAIDRIMVKAQERGMTTGDYVFIIPLQTQSRIMSLWSNQTVITKEQEVIRSAFNTSLFVEVVLPHSDKWQLFKNRQPEIVQLSINDEIIQSYSPFLHDSIYSYALALNRTLEFGGNVSDGRMIMEFMKGMEFHGASGHVVLDDRVNRIPTFTVNSFSHNGYLVQLARLQPGDLDPDSVNPEGQRIKYVVEMIVPEWSAWLSSAGIVPISNPDCGWFSEGCTHEAGQDKIIRWTSYGMIGLFVVMIYFGCVISLCYFKKRLLTTETKEIPGIISSKDLTKIKDLVRPKTVIGLFMLTLPALLQHQKHQSSFMTLGSMSEQIVEAILKGVEMVANYKGSMVWMKVHTGNTVWNLEKDQIDLKIVLNMSHENINRFVGLCIDTLTPISLWAYCSRGSLADVLGDKKIKLDWFFKYSLIKDKSAGLEYLHHSELVSHGYLKSSNCLIDQWWILKITDYGLPILHAGQGQAPKDKLWTAPEILRDPYPTVQGSQKGDIYSFGIIISEIITRQKPFAMFQGLADEEMVSYIARGEDPLLRPTIRKDQYPDLDPRFVKLMNDCLIEEPDQRPGMKKIRQAIRQMGYGQSGSLIDYAVGKLNTIARDMDEQVSSAVKQLEQQAKRTEALLYQMLPPLIARKLRNAEEVEPEAFKAATIFFSDIADFHLIAHRSNPFQLMTFINEVYTMLDTIIEKYDVYKVETVNNSYLVVSGLPKRNGTKHASEIADLALHLQSAMQSFSVQCMPGEKFELRVGIHTGPVVVGAVGMIMPRFCLFGDTVNTASRIETSSKPSCIHISEETNKYLTKIIGSYVTRPRGEIVLKGKGAMSTYWLLGKKGQSIIDKTGDYKAAELILEEIEDCPITDVKRWV